MRHLQVNINSIEDDSHWVTGSIGDGMYEFYAKLEDEEVKYGIDNGRTIKLVIRKGEVENQINESEFWEKVVVNYDRKWIIKPQGSASTEIFYAVLDELEKISPYKERIYGGSLINKIIAKTKNVFALNVQDE